MQPNPARLQITQKPMNHGKQPSSPSPNAEVRKCGAKTRPFQANLAQLTPWPIAPIIPEERTAREIRESSMHITDIKTFVVFVPEKARNCHQGIQLLRNIHHAPDPNELV